MEQNTCRILQLSSELWTLLKHTPRTTGEVCGVCIVCVVSSVCVVSVVYVVSVVCVVSVFAHAYSSGKRGFRPSCLRTDKDSLHPQIVQPF